MFFKKEEPKITFYSKDYFQQYDMMPAPASKYVPLWFKKLVRHHEAPLGPGTVKTCVPVLDVLTAGYIIPAPCDFHLSLWKEDDKLRWEGAWQMPRGHEVITEHHPSQVGDQYLMKNGLGWPLKFNNLFTIKTPPGYSCLFTNPFNNDHLQQFGIDFVSAIVDTDKYTLPINFPFIFSKIGERHEMNLIQQGTPLVQVIPFKRENWTHEMKDVDEFKEQKDVFHRIHTKFIDRYKKFHHSPKKFR